jgi:transposase
VIQSSSSGKCPGCGDEIKFEDEIGKVDGDWVCKNCVETAGGEDD